VEFGPAAAFGVDPDGGNALSQGVGDDLSGAALTPRRLTVPKRDQDVGPPHDLAASSLIGFLTASQKRPRLHGARRLEQALELLTGSLRLEVRRVLLRRQREDRLQVAARPGEDLPGDQPVRSFGQRRDRREHQRGVANVRDQPGDAIQCLPDPGLQGSVVRQIAVTRHPDPHPERDRAWTARPTFVAHRSLPATATNRPTLHSFPRSRKPFASVRMGSRRTGYNALIRAAKARHQVLGEPDQAMAHGQR